MKLGEIAGAVTQPFSAKRVYGEPVEKDGVVVIPAAMVAGGGGGGVDTTGKDAKDGKSGVTEGAGFGILSRPVGAFVIRDGEVAWVPAVDRTVLGLAGASVAIALMSMVAVIARAHHRKA
jgi:uncharacterized spore protein YtfJ